MMVCGGNLNIEHTTLGMIRLIETYVDYDCYVIEIFFSLTQCHAGEVKKIFTTISMDHRWELSQIK